MSMRALSFVLVFGGEDASLLEESSVSIARLHRDAPGVVLGPDSLPHLTLLQIEAERSEAPELWRQAEAEVPTTAIEIALAGLCLLPAPDDSEVWVEIPALKSDALQGLQDHLASLPLLAGRQIFNGVRDNFRPHVTLSLLPVAPKALPANVMAGALLRRRVNGYLALGVSGKNYSLIEILHAAGD